VAYQLTAGGLYDVLPITRPFSNDLKQKPIRRAWLHVV